MPAHAEDAFDRRDLGADVRTATQRCQVVPPARVASSAEIQRPAHYGEREANVRMLADYIVQIRKLRRKDLEPAFETMAPQDA